MSLQMLKIFDQILTKKIDLVSIPVHFLSKGYTPNQSIDSFVGVVFREIRSMEMKLENGVICLKHAFQAGLKDVTFLEVHRSRTTNNF